MRPKKFQKYDILVVSWLDIVSESKWHNKEEVENAEAVSVKTIGFFLDNKKRQLRIAHSIAKDGDCDVTVIPYGCINKIENLSEVK